MKRITNHLWFDTQAVEAANFYISVFKNSKILNQSILNDTPSGNVDVVNLEIAGLQFSFISAGPLFKFNSSISFYTTFDNEEEITEVWNKLVEGGKVMMEFNIYPWAKKYGWLEDKFGVSWQLSFNNSDNSVQKITPALMFVGENAGKAIEAVEFYTSIFPNSKIDLDENYQKGEGDDESFVKHSRFNLNGNSFVAMDSSFDHKFSFNESISFMVKCKDQKELDYYWEKLSAFPEAEQCGWLKDKFGVSWQIVPAEMDEMMEKGDPERIKRVTEAFLKMKEFDIAKLREAYEG